MRSKRIVEQLGIPQGTAQARLRKNILFHLLKKLNENVCFKCQKTIESAASLSIEHKEPWEGRDSSLFWNIENIAFSHVGCNKPHRSGHWWKTPEQRKRDRQDKKNAWERENYTPEKRHERYETTGN
jgi:hypothetical protein